MTDPIPRRSIALASGDVNEAGEPILLLACDCGAATELTLAGLEIRPDEGHELAMTCDGCLTPHWIRLHIEVVGEGGSG